MTIGRALPIFTEWDKAELWRPVAALLGVSALALLVAALVARPAPDFSERPVIAVVRDGGQHPLWAFRLAGGAHQIAVDSLAPPPAPPGHAYQLWLEVPGIGTLRPLGLLPQSGRKVIAETPANSRLLSGRGEVVVTLEAKGGSQQSGPSGPALFRGQLDGPG
ncbi:MAG: anti-sigma factor domain-containing protein [Stellaceae bacterium]